VEGGQKVKQAGMELSEYVMPGLGGVAMWKEHAIHTARVLNQINPDFIRLRTLRVPHHLELKREMEKGNFELLTEDGVAEEIKLFIQHLEGITSFFASDHIGNLLETVQGYLPGDKDKMIAVVGVAVNH
jgi:histone acetyltransferase (RNA polymerase elongator complex component)